MRRSRKWQWMLGLILAGCGSPAESASTNAPAMEASLTVEVTNYARVDAKTLAGAEEMAAEVFQKAGVQTRWIDPREVSFGPSGDSGETGSNVLSDLRVQILSQEMANRLGMPDNVMGLAPGKGIDRRMVYVFYEYVRQLAQRQIRQQTKGNVLRHATAAQILGEMMAHELGHILLNLPSHSQTGIMRGDWDLKDLGDVAYGLLFFTPQQAKVIRTDAARRNSRKDGISEISRGILPAISERGN